MSELDDKIKKFIGDRPWLKIVLTLALWALGTAKGKQWFAVKYGVK